MACDRPRLRRRIVASSRLPPASVRTALHSIIPAPVWSRSFFTSSAGIVATRSARRPWPPRRAASALSDRVSHPGREEPDRPKGVVVARDDVVDLVRVAIRVDDADDRNLQLARLVDGDLLVLGVDDEDRVGQAAHAADAVEVLGELALLLFVAGDLFLRQRVVAAVGLHGLEVAQALQTALDRREIRQEAAEPPLIHEVHAAALGLFGDRVLRLALRAHEEQRAAVGRDGRHKVRGFPIELCRAPEVENVDPVPLTEDEGLHLRVPALGLVAEMDTRLEKVFDSDRAQRAQLLRSLMALTLAELEALAGAGHAVLLAFLGARVARQEPGL